MVCTCWDEFWVKLLFETSCCSLPCYKFEVVPESCSQKTSSSSVVRGFWPPQYGSGNLWAGLIRLHCLYRHSREYHLDLRLTVVSHDLKTSGLTSSVNSLGLYLDCPWLEGGGLYFFTKPFHLSLASDSVRGGFCRLRISSIALISLLRASPSPLSIHGLIYLLILTIGVLISGTDRSRIGVLCIN